METTTTMRTSDAMPAIGSTARPLSLLPAPPTTAPQRRGRPLADPSHQSSAPTSSSKPERRRPRSRRMLSLLPSTLASLLLLSLIAATPTLASQGDRSPEFQTCLKSCVADNCGREVIDDGVVLTRRLPLILRATFWSCQDNCKYHCTHAVTNDAYARVAHIREDAWTRARYLPLGGTGGGETGAQPEERTDSARRAEYDRIVQTELAQLRPVQKEMVQYYGKWVFIRVLGLQEPFSVLFSILNLREHLNAFYKLRRDVPDAYPLKLVYILHSLISINAWTWSAVFHARDKPLTERLDYFSAASTLLSGLFFTICRLFRLEPDAPRFSTLLRSFAFVFVLHCLYLSFGRFDYGYNVLACLFVAAVHELLWLAFSLRPSVFPSNQLLERYHSNRAAYRAAKPQTSNIATASGSSGVGGVGGAAVAPPHFASSAAATSSSSPLPAPAAWPAATYKGHSPPGASISGALNGSSHPHPPPHPLALTTTTTTSSSSSLANGPPSSSREARRDLQRILLLLLAAMSLEIFDFPPLFRTLDAHALWHAATVPLVRMWYDWLIRDARECVFSGWFVGDALGGSATAARMNGRGGAAAAAAWGWQIGSRMLRPSEGFRSDGYAGLQVVRMQVGALVGQTREWASDRLRGRAGSLEFHALTAKLNALAERAGFASAGEGLDEGVEGEHGRRRGGPGSSSSALSVSSGAGLLHHGAVGLGGDGAHGIKMDEVGLGSGSAAGLVKRSEREEKGKEVLRHGLP
ncbi:hypothetical protein V8E36_000670 [Tilletia maclaganii]